MASGVAINGESHSIEASGTSVSTLWPVTDGVPGFYENVQNKAIKTVWTIILAVFVQVILVTSTFLIPWFCLQHGTNCPVSELSLVIYIHLALWLVVLGIHVCLRHQHIVSRRQGYGAFYRRTVRLRRTQFYVLSIGSVIMFAMLTVLNDVNYCKTTTSTDDPCVRLFSTNFLPVYWVQVLVSLETLVCLPVLLIYFVQTIKFNRLQMRPDIFHESPLTPDAANRRFVVGFRNKSLIEETIERQFDAIRYLTARCELLTQALSGISEHQADVLQQQPNSPADFNTSLDTSLLMTD